MINYIKELVKEFSYLYRARESNLPLESVRYYLTRGEVGPRFGEKRQQTYLLTLDSFSNTDKLAYSRLVKIREYIYSHRNIGSDKASVSNKRIPEMQDLSYIEAKEHVFRYRLDIEFLGLEVVDNAGV